MNIDLADCHRSRPTVATMEESFSVFSKQLMEWIIASNERRKILLVFPKSRTIAPHVHYV